MKLFRKDEAIQAVLYILNSLGGSCDLHKLSKILYFADQRHLSEYGRSITGDTYIAMQYGPVPSAIYDIIKALRPDSYFHTSISDQTRLSLSMTDNKIVKANVAADKDYLSDSEIECLDSAIDKCRDLDFMSLVALSHGYAWRGVAPDSPMLVSDILREAGENEPYIQYIEDLYKLRAAL